MTSKSRLDTLARIIPLQHFEDSRGKLGVAEIAKLCGFSAQRFYFLYGTQGRRGAHAHRHLRQLMIALTGRVEITLDSGEERKTYVLDSPKQALAVDPVVWRELNLSADAVLGVLASEPYSEEEYIRDYNTFLETVAQIRSDKLSGN